ncbi:MAG: site-specific integrase [Solirubrobacteraceae bacterium MAG38_C4-C5]|nr:site-specific integrase [Candidatus Siliceabacter maunaloa]
MSVHRQTDGWRVKWREGSRQRSRTFERKRDAEVWDAEVKRRRQLGPLAVQQLTERGPTLGEWITQRWSREHGATLAKRTRDRYASSYELHVAPWLDDVPIRELTVSRLRAWQAERTAQGESADTIQKARTFLSSVLRHAAESEAIPANPLALVRAPRAEHREEVVPLAPATVEAIRAVLAAPMPVAVAERAHGTRRCRAYEQPDQRSAAIRQRDACLVCLLAYSGLRPSEAGALRWADVRDRTLLTQRATEADGTVKSTKGRKARTVRLLAPLATDLREWRMAAGRPPDTALVFPRSDGAAWTKEDWGNWRSRTWRAGCERSHLDPVPRPYDLRHSFASLLLAEGRTIHYVAAQLGHSPALTLGTYGHVLAEYAEGDSIDVEAEIVKARAENVPSEFPQWRSGLRAER